MVKESRQFGEYFAGYFTSYPTKEDLENMKFDPEIAQSILDLNGGANEYGVAYIIREVPAWKWFPDFVKSIQSPSL